MNNTQERLDALKAHLVYYGDATPEELQPVTVDRAFDSRDNTFRMPCGDYKVLTDEEADEETREVILESLWAFKADFIIRHTEFWNTCTGLEAMDAEDALEEMQGKLCESANALVRALIADIDKFVEDAIDADGRGHFLAFYDGLEDESGKYYVYRTN